MKLWRQGDVYIQAIEAIPAGVQRRGNLVLAHGEVTGHTHRVPDSAAATLFSRLDAEHGELFLDVRRPTTVIHDEHAPVPLDPGCYRIWRQREYTPEVIRTVLD